MLLLSFSGREATAVHEPAGMPSTWTVAVSIAVTVPPVTCPSRPVAERELLTWATTVQPAGLHDRFALPSTWNRTSASTALSSCLVASTSSSKSLSTSCCDSELTSIVVPAAAGADTAGRPALRGGRNAAVTARCGPRGPHAEAGEGSDGIEGAEDIPGGVVASDGREGTAGRDGILAPDTFGTILRSRCGTFRETYRSPAGVPAFHTGVPASSLVASSRSGNTVWVLFRATRSRRASSAGVCASDAAAAPGPAAATPLRPVIHLPASPVGSLCPSPGRPAGIFTNVLPPAVNVCIRSPPNCAAPSTEPE